MPTKIEWTEQTWNPVTGCTKISEGCTHCYAKKVAETRLRGRYGYPEDEPFRVTFHRDKMLEPLSWWKKPRMIFVCSMGDLFHEGVPDLTIRKIFKVMASTHKHTYQILTKRPRRMKAFIDGLVYENDFTDLYGSDIELPLKNVWIGVTAENQQRANERIPILLQTPAAVRFVSCEPLLGSIKIPDVFMTKLNWGVGLMNWPDGAGTIDQIIVGGETGPGSRPMHPDWAKTLRDQCIDASVPFFFKSWGDWLPASDMSDEVCDSIYRSNRKARYEADQANLDDAYGRTCKVDNGVINIDGSFMTFRDPRAFRQGLRSMSTYRIKKMKAGRLLDGIEWNQYPEVG